MKDTVCAAVGLGAGVVSWLVGGFDTPILALIICMGADYVTGLIVAGVFHTSPKTKSGGLDSRVGWKGLARKFVTLLIVVVANLADLLLGLHYIRDAVIAAFCANECISILENAGLMGIRIPRVLTEAMEKLGEVVLSVMKMGGDALLEIAFDDIGTKKLMAKTASAHMKKL